MNAKVRRYQPLFLSPQVRYTTSPPKHATPNWKSKINHQVTICYNNLKSKNSESKYSLAQKPQQRHQNHPPHEGKLHQAVKSYSTQSNIQTPLKKKHLQMFNYQTISTTVYKSQREKQMENYYNYRIQLLQEQCIYLRKQFINHCLKNHKAEFQKLSY